MPWGWRRRWLMNRGFGWERGYGWRRWQVAMAYNDPERALFGLGPCGELAYQEYKKIKTTSTTSNPATTEYQDEKTWLENEIKYLKQRLEELEKLYREKYGKE